jgi:hypothetical protein
VNVGDLDGDGKHEIVFPVSDDDSEGYHIYEWDGVVGSDNYGTTYASVCQVEIDKCCAGDGAGTATYGASFRGDHDRLTIFDVDGDGRDEFVQHIRRGLPNRLFLHQADNTIQEAPKKSGANYLDHTSAALFIDIDNDAYHFQAKQFLTG